MGLREWIIGLAVIFMLVLAADAWRRMKRQKQYRGAYVKPQARQGSSNDTVRVSRVAGRAPVTAPGHYSHRRPDPSVAEPEEQVSPEPAATAEPPAAEPEPESEPETAFSDEPPVSSFDTPFSRAAHRLQSTARQSAAPGALREKVPMLLDSVEDPEPEADATVPENQFEFDLQPPAARSRGERGGERMDAGSPCDDSEDSWEDDIDPDDVLLSARRPEGQDFAAEFSESVRVQQEALHSDHQSDPAVDRAEPPAAASPESPEHRPRSNANAPADVSPFAHLARPFKPSEPEPEAVAPEPTEPEPEPMSALDQRQEATEPARADGAETLREAALRDDEYADTYDDAAGDQLLSEPEQVLVITVLARPGEAFEGASLLQILLACGMRFGNMNIFHATDDEGRLQYSAANAYNPGTFDLDDIEHFSTRGVTFFMQLPCQCKAMEGFGAMYDTAATLANNMNGEILDDTRSVMTSQTLTHYQERIRDYQRAQLVKRA